MTQTDTPQSRPHLQGDIDFRIGATLGLWNPLKLSEWGYRRTTSDRMSHIAAVYTCTLQPLAMGVSSLFALTLDQSLGTSFTLTKPTDEHSRTLQCPCPLSG